MYIQLNRFDVLQKVYHNKLTETQLRTLMKHKKVRYSHNIKEKKMQFIYYGGDIGKSYFEWDYYLLLFMNNIVEHKDDEIVIFDTVIQTVKYMNEVNWTLGIIYDVKYGIIKCTTTNGWEL